jgi:hypothetical protein
MNSISRLFDRRAGYIVAAFAVLLAAILPSLAFAAQATERSIQLSSTSVNATGVTYTVNFKSVSGAGAFVVDFCENTPLLGEACTSPATSHGFSATSAASTTSGFTGVSALDANTVRVTGTIAADTAISVALTGINNPNVVGPLYARIVTYDTPTNADLYTSAGAAEGVGGAIDSGSIAVSITPTVGVSGAVLESMTFCVSKDAPTQNCVGVTAPTLELGEDVGAGVIALSSNAVSTGDIYTQLSTNAASGAVVRLKSNALSCGGLLRAGAPSACDILPALTSGDITLGQAKFGVKAAAATDPTGSGTPNGTFRVASGSSYNASTYELNYVAGNGTGVTSTYGDSILDTNNLPINNRNMKLTFGASISNNTPAGKYSADLSLIATGKF